VREAADQAARQVQRQQRAAAEGAAHLVDDKMRWSRFARAQDQGSTSVRVRFKPSVTIGLVSGSASGVSVGAGLGLGPGSTGSGGARSHLAPEEVQAQHVAQQVHRVPLRTPMQPDQYGGHAIAHWAAMSRQVAASTKP